MIGPVVFLVRVSSVSYVGDVLNTLADPGVALGVRPPKEPNSFVLTYKFYET